jgi:hypothetical protein
MRYLYASARQPEGAAVMLVQPQAKGKGSTLIATTAARWPELGLLGTYQEIAEAAAEDMLLWEGSGLS